MRPFNEIWQYLKFLSRCIDFKSNIISSKQLLHNEDTGERRGAKELSYGACGQWEFYIPACGWCTQRSILKICILGTEMWISNTWVPKEGVKSRTRNKSVILKKINQQQQKNPSLWNNSFWPFPCFSFIYFFVFLFLNLIYCIPISLFF